jgi:two-component sensor histidine kinase
MPRRAGFSKIDHKRQRNDPMKHQAPHDRRPAYWNADAGAAGPPSLSNLRRELERSRARERALLMELADRTRDNHEQSLLLHEADHRLKNMLQLAASMLQMQLADGDDPELKRRIGTVIERLRNLARVHAAICQTGDHDRISVEPWLKNICQAMALNPSVAVDVQVDQMEWPAAVATPLGLFVTEALSNALKHAFDGRGQGRIAVTLARAGAADWRLSVADDGPGRPDKMGSGLGLKLLDVFARQLGGRADIGSGLEGRGLCVSAIFPAPTHPRHAFAARRRGRDRGVDPSGAQRAAP